MLNGHTLLTALLVISTALFAAGVIAERNTGEPPHEQRTEASAKAGHDESERSEDGAHTEEAAHSDEAAAEEGHDDDERLLGVDLESTPLIILGVVFGLALAAATAYRQSPRRRELLLAIAGATLLWAALDVRELLHQIDESRTAIAVLAGAVAVTHLACATLAAWIATRQAPQRT